MDKDVPRHIRKDVPQREQWHTQRLPDDGNLCHAGDEVLVLSGAYSGESAVIKKFRYVYDYDQNYEYDLELLGKGALSIQLVEPYLALKSRTVPLNIDSDHAAYIRHSTLPEWSNAYLDIHAVMRRYTRRGYCEMPERYFIRHWFPDSMTEQHITEAIRAAYSNAKRISFNRYPPEDISEYAALNVRHPDQERVLFEGHSDGTTIHFWFNFTEDCIEGAYPVV